MDPVPEIRREKVFLQPGMSTEEVKKTYGLSSDQAYKDKSILKFFLLLPDPLSNILPLSSFKMHPKARENIDLVWLWTMGQGVQTGGKMINGTRKGNTRFAKRTGRDKEGPICPPSPTLPGRFRDYGEGWKAGGIGYASKNHRSNHPRPDKKTPAVDFRIHFKRNLRFPNSSKSS